MNAFLMAAEASLPSTTQTTTMWETLTSGGESFISGFLSPTLELASSNAICLAFLTVTFVKLGVKMVKSFSRSLGKG